MLELPAALRRALRPRVGHPTPIRVDGASAPGWEAYERELGSRTFVWFWGDDPLDHPDIARYVRIAVQRGLRTGLTTHATRLDNTTAHHLLEAGLGHIEVLVAGTADRHQEHFGGDREDALGNVERLILMRDARRLPAPRVTLACATWTRRIVRA